MNHFAHSHGRQECPRHERGSGRILAEGALEAEFGCAGLTRSPRSPFATLVKEVGVP